MHDYDRVYTDTDDYFGEASPLVSAHLDLIPAGGRILDIGVGQGRNAVGLAAKGYTVVGVDPSEAAVEQTRARAAAAGTEVELHRCGILDYQVEEPFDAVFCFGLMQILSRGECASLVHRIFAATSAGSALFLTAWHVDDPSFERVSDSWERVALHSFRGPGGEYRTYLARGVVRNLFRNWRTVHYHEGLGPLHGHGDGEEHRHGDIEFVAVRRGDSRL